MSKKNLLMELLKKRDAAEQLSGFTARVKGPAGVVSKYNASSTNTATITNTIYVLGMLLQGNVKALFNDNTDSAYVEITYGQGDVVKAVVSKEYILYADDVSKLAPERVVDLASVFALCGYDEELRELLSAAKVDYDNGGLITLINALKICDNTYFNSLSKLNEDFDIVNHPTLEEEVRQGIRSGSFTECLMLKEFNCADTSIKVEMHKASSEHKSEIPDDVMEVLDMCKDGKFRINYNWGEDAKYIPSLDVLDTFVPTQHFVPLIKKINKKLKRVLTRMDMGMTGRKAIGHDYINVEFTGRPGTGKTTLAEVLAAIFGMPIHVSKNSDDVEDDEFEGKTKPIDGKFDFVETAFLKGFTNGGFIVDEEYNLTKPGIKMGAVGQAIESPFILKRNGYEDVTRHPLTIYVATSNVNTEGTKDVSQPFSTRSKNAYVIEDPDDETFIKILKAWDSEFKTNDCKKVLDAYKKIINYLCSNKVEAPEIALKISIRQCMGALETMYEGNSFKYAIETSMIGKIHQSNEEIANDVRRTILANLRD